MERINTTLEADVPVGAGPRRRLGAPDLPRGRSAFWKEYLEGAPRSLQLPTDHPRTSALARRFASAAFELDAETTAALTSLTRGRRPDLFVTLAAAFGVLLHRYSRQGDICISYPAAAAGRGRGQDDEGAESPAHTLILRVRIEPGQTFRELLGQVRASVLRAWEHRGVPFDVLAEELGPEPDPGYSSVLQASLALDDEPAAGREVAGAVAEAPESAAGDELSLRLRVRGGRLAGVFRYNAGLFDAPTVERMSGHLKSLLAAAASDPDARVSRLPLLTEAERRQTLVEWNDTRADFPAGLCLHELFEERAAETPDAVAAVFGGQQTLYGELNARANQLAHHLLALGVGPETRVALCVERSPEMLVALLGVLKAGAAYAPLDPEFPPERMGYILADSGAPVLLTQSRLTARMPRHGAQVICLDTDWPLIARRPTHNPKAAALPGNLAYCIYTSGSTGRPKAVVVTHSNIVNQVTQMRRQLGVRPDDRMLQFTALSFDACLQEIFPTWLGGGTLVLPPVRLLSPLDFLRMLREERVTILSLPFSYWKPLVDELSSSDVNWFESLRIAFVGGEKVPAEKFRQWTGLACARDIVWIQDYGPTEGTQSCVTYTAEPAREWEVQVPIGRPIGNVQVYVLDGELGPVPVGVVGEIYLGGAGLARGYWNRPGLTAEKFIPNPFAGPGERMYTTGDLGYFLPDGNIQFFGRADHQVKILGHRVELGEIEIALSRCEGVREVVVIVREDSPGDRRLVAYVAAEGFDEAAARMRLSESLTDKMIPAAFVVLDELPRSPANLKVDRTRLPEPKAPDATPALPDASPLERAIAPIWAQAAGRHPGSVDEDFFLAGGDSLRALRLLGNISGRTGVKLDFADFFEARTLRGLAASLLKKSARGGDAGPPGREAAMVESLSGGTAGQRPRLRRREAARRPASNAQERLWFLNQFEAGAATYSVPLGYVFRGPFSAKKLDAALTSVVARHEALRTGLVMEGGTLWQEIAPPTPVRSERLEAGSYEEAMRRARAEAGLALDMSRPPLLRSLCVRFGPDEVLVVLIVHHAVCDAWSLGVLWRELTALYRGADEASRLLAEPVFHYADYVDWQREWLKGPEAEAQRAFWRDRLAGDLPLLRMNDVQPSDAARSYRGAVEGLRIDGALRRAVGDAARLHSTTEFVVILSAFLATLHRYTRQDQIVVGVPAACRSLPETDGIIGFFANTLALRAFLPEGSSFSELVARTTKELSDMMTNQELPFDEVVDSLDLPRRVGTNPAFQAMFVMQSTPLDAALELEGVRIEEKAVHTGTAKFDLTCSVRSNAAGLEGELEYSLDVMDGPGAARFVEAFLSLLSDSTRRPSARLDELQMLSDEEGEALIRAANSRFESYPDFEPVHAHFEAQARLNPDAVAVESGEGAIRYGELNERADRLARRLAEAGAGPESLVGVCVDRSPEMAVALLAVLKAGAAFVPLDPGFPAERIRGICEDAGALLVVTQERHRRGLSALRTPLIVEGEARGVGPGAGVGVPISPENAAYVYYTSGSTGFPKGVVIDHRCAMNRLEWLRRRYPLGAGDRVLHKTPLVFDVAIWELFGPLMAGATVLMADAGAEADVAHIGRLLSTERTVFTHFVPSMLDAYLNFARPAGYPDLRWVQLSGEAVAPRLLERFREHFSAEFHNLYGQTETSEVAGWEAAGGAPSRVPVGRQIGVYRLHVLDAGLNPVPPGVPGELCVAGLGGLARGYHGRPGLTAEKFAPNPYAVEPGERLYRTGDLARLTEDGVIEYAGRLDHQIKIRGCRVETAEVEAVLARHGSVRACAVVARDDDGGAARLFAYVVGSRPSAAELGAHAERFLPKYMLPAAYVFLDELPLTPSGKLDRLKLPAPRASDFEARVSGRAPGTPLEEDVAGAWKQVLGLNRVGAADNFFVIGGNSLKCIQVIARLKERFGVELSVRDFFSSPTVEGLASLCERALTEFVTSLSDAEAEQRLEELEA